MNPESIIELTRQGEGSRIEFKLAQNKLSRDAFETICAFLNRFGGHLLLGVSDNGEITGIDEAVIPQIVNQIATNSNNPQKLNPPFYLAPQVVEVEKKKIIYIFVPESSLVHATNGKIFDRNDDGDLDITSHQHLVSQLYLRKQLSYSENTIYPFLKLTDLRSDLFIRIRHLVKSSRPTHPWLEMDTTQLLRSAGMFKKDYQTGKEGYTLAAALLLGKDEVIHNILPFHKTDALLRIDNIDRYDDRDDIRTNLIESYDRLMIFIQKHLPDKFHLEGDQRVSLRDKLFREVMTNILIHREYTNPFPSKLIIEKDRVYTENWNKPQGAGKIDPSDYSPRPKNPVIAGFFKELGRADELGSGVTNIFKYASLYAPGMLPELIEGDVFKTIIPLIPINVTGTGNGSVPDISHNARYAIIENLIDHFSNEGVYEGVNEGVNEVVKQRLARIIELISEQGKIKSVAISNHLKVSQSTIERDLKVLKKLKIVIYEGSPKSGGYTLAQDFLNKMKP